MKDGKRKRGVVVTRGHSSGKGGKVGHWQTLLWRRWGLTESRVGHYCGRVKGSKR